MKGSAFLAPLDFMFAASIFDDYEAFVSRVPDAGMTAIVFEFVPFHKLLLVPQGATAFANRGAYGNLLFLPGWFDLENDGECREWPRLMAEKGSKEFKRRSKDENKQAGVGQYANYDGYNQSPEALFGKNSPRLAELKKKWDPDNVFRKGPRLTE